MVKRLIEMGAKINATGNIMGELTTALMSASMGDLEVAKYLISQGADVNARAYNDTTALMLALSEGHFEVMDFLIKSGADASAKDDKGKTALDYLNKYKNR